MRVEIDVDWQHHASKHKAGIDMEPAVQSNIGEVAKAQQNKVDRGQEQRRMCRHKQRERYEPSYKSTHGRRDERENQTTHQAQARRRAGGGPTIRTTEAQCSPKWRQAAQEVPP
jgi:hypothetical protein